MRMSTAVARPCAAALIVAAAAFGLLAQSAAQGRPDTCCSRGEVHEE